ncbi:hypothetical protein [Proteiniclasticum sp.]|uniref:hypothetical protein n=1 Tax=Proteiniclasticum sp. TaxID=2053595 RepID=UPI0028A131AF|nr:hypothetical protein [Proteiniclasticum sp.]
MAIEACKDFTKTYRKMFKNIDEVHENCLELGYSYISKYLQEAVSTLIAHDIFHIDQSTFFETYYKNYIDWDEEFEKIDILYREIVFSAEEEKLYREERKEGRSRWQGGGFGMGAALEASIKAGAMNAATGLAHSVFNNLANKLTDTETKDQKVQLFENKSILKKLATSIYNNVYEMHYALIDALIDNDVEIETYVSDENYKKSKTLTNNLKTGLIPQDKEEILLKNIIYCNPYNEEIYLYLLGKYGDENRGIHEICAFLNLDIKNDIKLILKNYYDSLPKHDENATKDSVIAFEKYAQKLGIQNISSYQDDFDKILQKHDLAIRTVDGIIFETRDEAESAANEFNQIIELKKKTDFKSEESVLAAINEIRLLKTPIGNKYLNIFNEKLNYAIKYQDQFLLDQNFSLSSITSEKMADSAIQELEKIKNRNMDLVEKRLQEIKAKRLSIIEAEDKRILDNFINSSIILNYTDAERVISDIKKINLRTEKLSSSAINTIFTDSDKIIKKHNDMLDKAIKYQARMSSSKKIESNEHKKSTNTFSKAFKSGSGILDRTQEKREKEGWDFITQQGHYPEKVESLRQRRQDSNNNYRKEPSKMTIINPSTHVDKEPGKIDLESSNVKLNEEILSSSSEKTQSSSDQLTTSNPITTDVNLLAINPVPLADDNPTKELETKKYEAPKSRTKKRTQKTLLLVICGILLVSGTAFATQKYTQMQHYDEMLIDAELYLKEGRYTEAINLFEESLKIKDNDEVVLSLERVKLLNEAITNYNEGIVLLNSKNYLDALQKFEKIPSMDHEIYQLSLEKIVICKEGYVNDTVNHINDSISMKNYDEANKYIDELLKFDETNTEASSLKQSLEKKIQEEKDKAEAERVAAEKVEAEKANKITYKKYHNERYGFTISYPDYFIKGEPPANGDGLSFTGSDGTSLSVSGSNNVMDDTAYSLYDNLLNSVDGVIYAEQNDNWYAVIGSDQDMMVYKREVVGSGSINTIVFYFPPEHHDKYKEYLNNMNIYFETPYIEESR